MIALGSVFPRVAGECCVKRCVQQVIGIIAQRHYRERRAER